MTSNPDWTSVVKLNEMAKHFRLGNVMRELLRANGRWTWRVWLSGFYREEPEDVQGSGTHVDGEIAKERACLALVNRIEHALNPASEVAAYEPGPASDGFVRQMIVGSVVNVLCDICQQFVDEEIFHQHLLQCHRNVVSELRPSGEYTCRICMEVPGKDNYMVAIPRCNHVLCNDCWEQIIPTSNHRRRCPFDNREVRERPERIFL